MPLRDYLVGDASRVAWLLLGAVAGLLLIACVNVTNLILARLAARDREFAVRSALGAGRARLARLALTESLLLAVAGGGLGLLFAAAMLRVFVRLAPSSIPEIGQASLDLRVFAVAAVLALAAGVAVGIWPALSVLRSRALQYGARATAAARPRMRFTLVTVQIALTVAMLAGSALLLRTLWNLVAVPLGYQSERVVTMDVTPNVARYPKGCTRSVLRAVAGAYPRDPRNGSRDDEQRGPSHRRCPCGNELPCRPPARDCADRPARVTATGRSCACGK